MNLNATLIGQSISFLIFCLFCIKYVWPPVIAVLNERQKKIANTIEASRQADKRLIEAKHIAETSINKASKKAHAIIETSKKEAQQIINEAKQQAIKEANFIIEDAKKDINNQIQLSKKELHNKVAELVINGAEKLIAGNYDKAQNDNYIETLINEL
jgi:F-type H+-transporting ATPase subunit b